MHLVQKRKLKMEVKIPKVLMKRSAKPLTKSNVQFAIACWCSFMACEPIPYTMICPFIYFQLFYAFI